MSCTFPLIAYDATEHTRSPGSTRSLVFVRLGESVPSGFTELRVPCGQCIECRLRYAREWAARCMIEAEASTCAWFLTLTYDDTHLPVSYTVDTQTGEASPLEIAQRLSIEAKASAVPRVSGT